MIQEKEHSGVVFSCEVFPPKRDDDIYQIYKTLDEIKTLNRTLSVLHMEQAEATVKKPQRLRHIFRIYAKWRHSHI